jgi:cyclopropane-fatty-acyl-phospholipid synthase
MRVLTATKGERDLPRWFPNAFEVLKGMKAGRVDVALPDGRLFRAEGPEAGPSGRIDVRNPGLFARVARDGETGFAEAYMDGWWDTPDLQALLDVLLMNNGEVGRAVPGAALVRAYERLRHWLNRNSRAGSRRNIAAHYDLGNSFYRLWLDETMTYSAAMFGGAPEPLEAAQRRKYASICDMIGVRPGQHLLEIGCGWGGFAEFATRERGARVTGLTISRQQHDFARKRLFDAGLAERAEIVMRDYRDERGRFDGVASIEMFEAVGERYWPVYFRSLRDRLGDGARAALQVITVDDGLFDGYRKGADFVQKHIFPGGMLPSPSALRREFGSAGLREVGEIRFGESYSETLRLWYRTFNDRWHEIATLGFDDRFRRMWNFYLASCAACFRSGTTDVTQVTLVRA